MANTVHATAVIDPQAKIGNDVAIGPFSVIEAGVVIGNQCELASRVVIKQNTILGTECVVEDGAVLGGKPQHGTHCGPTGGLRIGRGNTIRENVTIHRALTASEFTQIGDHNLIMVNAHIAHDCRIGDNTIITNNVMLAGHVQVDDFAYLSGGVAAHQFCRIGAHAMVGGQAHVKKDIPPYVTVDGQSTRVVGLNLIGLKRRGFTSDQIKQLKHAYRIVYRRGLMWSEVLEELQRTFDTGPATAFHAFLTGGQRGFVLERRTPNEATVPLPRIYQESDEATQRRAS